MTRVGQFLGILLIITFFSLSSSQPIREYWPTKAWQNSTPEEEGLLLPVIQAMIKDIDTNEYDINSVVIVKNGFISYEYYIPSYSDKTNHSIFSVTKSVMSTLIGIAIKEGYLQNLNQPVIDFFPNSPIDNMSPEKANITILHLLTMSSGLDWNEYTIVNNDLIQFLFSSNPTQYVLNKTVISVPGSQWNYNTGGPHVLSAILSKTSNMTTRDFAELYLFNPLGITIAGWDADPQNLHFGGHGLTMNILDMARFGFLYLNDGYWESKQILPNGWVEEASQPLLKAEGNASYGYLWWVYPHLDVFAAEGLGGQKIFVFPEHDMVVVFTSSLAIGEDPFEHLIEEYILRSLKASNDTLSSVTHPNTDRMDLQSRFSIGPAIGSIFLGILIIAVVIYFRGKKK